MARAPRAPPSLMHESGICYMAAQSVHAPAVIRISRLGSSSGLSSEGSTSVGPWPDGLVDGLGELGGGVDGEGGPLGLVGGLVDVLGPGFGGAVGFGDGPGVGGFGAGFSGLTCGSTGGPATAGTTRVAPKNSSHHTGATRTTSPDCGA